jgi:RimJ/RimL family protein N-acetyltransferase
MLRAVEPFDGGWNQAFRSPTTLADDDLRLRPVRLPDDVGLATPWYRDPEVLRYSEGEGTQPYGPADVARMYAAMAERCELYVVEVRAAGSWHAIGDAALCGEHGLPIVIGEAAYRSRGVGARVLRLLVERARRLGWSRLVVKGVYTYNERGRRLYERAGFEVCGETTDEAGRTLWRMEMPLGSSGGSTGS